MNGEATGAPDKRVVGGAVPPTCTNSTGCWCCDAGESPVRLKRQKVHYINRKIIVCENRTNL